MILLDPVFHITFLYHNTNCNYSLLAPGKRFCVQHNLPVPQHQLCACTREETLCSAQPSCTTTPIVCLDQGRDPVFSTTFLYHDTNCVLAPGKGPCVQHNLPVPWHQLCACTREETLCSAQPSCITTPIVCLHQGRDPVFSTTFLYHDTNCVLAPGKRPCVQHNLPAMTPIVCLHHRRDPVFNTTFLYRPWHYLWLDVMISLPRK